MTNAQKWIAAFLGLFVVLFVLSKVTGFFEEDYEDLSGYGNEQAQAGESAPPSGLQLVENAGCTSCHGGNLEGTQMGPSLHGVQEYWNRSELINYLRNPSAYDGGERFDKYRQKFSKIVMPSYENKDVKELGKIADYLLTLDKAGSQE